MLCNPMSGNLSLQYFSHQKFIRIQFTVLADAAIYGIYVRSMRIFDARAGAFFLLIFLRRSLKDMNFASFCSQ